jgi:hypothetical protein
MTGETELESMLVRLRGDGSSYQKMLEQAAQATQNVVPAIQGVANKIEGIKNSITGFAASAAQALGALGISTYLHRAFDQFSEHEGNSIRLKAAITSLGLETETTFKKLEEFARVQRDKLGASFGETNNLMRQALLLYQGNVSSAENAVRTAQAVGVANQTSAQHLLLLNRALERGDALMLRRMLHLHGMRDNAQVLDIAQKQVNAAMLTAEQIMNSSEGQVKKFHTSIKLLTFQFGALVAEAVNPAIKWVTNLFMMFTKLDAEIKKWIVTIALGSVVLLALGPALRVIQSILSPIVSATYWVAHLAYQAGSLVLWIAIKAAVIAVNIAMTVGILPALIAIGAAVYGAWVTIRAFSEAVSILASGPIAHVSNLFKEWGGILKDVWELSKTNMPAAWTLLQAGFKLAVSQVSDLWPPLWRLIKDGFDATWTFVSNTFLEKMAGAFLEIARQISRSGEWLRNITGFGPAQGDAGRLANLNRAMQDYGIAAHNARIQLDGIAGSFRVIESLDTVLARSEVNRLRENLPWVRRHTESLFTEASAAQQVATAVGHVTAELYGSSSAMQKIMDQQQAFRQIAAQAQSSTPNTTGGITGLTAAGVSQFLGIAAGITTVTNAPSVTTAAGFQIPTMNEAAQIVIRNLPLIFDVISTIAGNPPVNVDQAGVNN